MTQQGKTLTYAYDDAGNILSVNDGSKTVSYSYDMLGQLIRANDPYDTTAGSAGTTWVYSYDLGGNMTSKKAYAYTTGNVGTAVQTISYTYGDSNWKDKLTAYNGAAISYDAIGNPTSDGTWTYTWAKGRQLQSMSKSGTSVSYTYNEDGLRVQKNVSGTVTSYILHGKNVVQLTQGSNNLHFFYGADGSPAVVMYNGASYGYVKNLQGDIVSIVNSSGAEVVHYTYDAWGKLLSKTGTLATTLGTLNPFRYRGYVYDEETGLYYLRSRYYNPTWGRFVNADSLAVRNLYAYCKNNAVVHADHSGALADDEDWSLFETYPELFSTPAPVTISAEESKFTAEFKPKMMAFLRDAGDYRYHSNGFQLAQYNEDGTLAEVGHVDCSHLMYEITGKGSYTARYRYTEYRGPKGKLFKGGKLAVELKEGMEVFKPSGENNEQGHVGMLMLYDFGNGLEWAVFQSASMEITKSYALFYGDTEGGPNITSLFDKQGVCTWKYYTAGYLD